MKQFKIILGLILFASVSTFAQSPRIKLNQITKDTIKGSVLISSPSDSGMVYSRDFYIAYGADTLLILYGDTIGGVGGGVNSIVVDPITLNGNGTTASPLSVDTATVISTIQGLVDSLLNYVTTNTTQTISGAKTFTNTFTQSGGDANFDSGTLYVDESLNRVGIGTTSPSQTVNVYKDANATNFIQIENPNGGASARGGLFILNGPNDSHGVGFQLTGNGYTGLTADQFLISGGSQISNGIQFWTSQGGLRFNGSSLDAADLYIADVTGNVGIGTASPQGFLSVEKQFPSASTLGFTVSDPRYSGLFQVKTNSSGFFFPAFEGYSGTETTVPSGVVLIGALDSSEDVYSNLWSTVVIQGREYDNFPNIPGPVENASILSVNNYVTNLFRIESDGGIFAPSLLNASTGNTMYYNTTTDEISYSSSSIRFKNDIEDLPIGLNELMMLKPTRYTYIPDGKKDYGFIAEQVYDVGLTEFVTFNQDNQIEGLKDKYFMILNTKAIQEQQAIIETQQTEIDQLKTLITDLTNRLIILENK